MSADFKYRVWHVAQIPMDAFFYLAPKLEEAVRVRKALGEYDLFQFEKRVKPDYSNMNGIEVPDPDNAGEWISLDDDELEEMLAKAEPVSP